MFPQGRSPPRLCCYVYFVFRSSMLQTRRIQALVELTLMYAISQYQYEKLFASLRIQSRTQFTTRRAGLLSLDCPDMKAVKQLCTRTQQNSTILTEPLPKSPRDTALSAFYQRPRLYYCWLKARGFKRSIRTLPESSKQQCLHQIFFWFESEY